MENAAFLIQSPIRMIEIDTYSETASRCWGVLRCDFSSVVSKCTKHAIEPHSSSNGSARKSRIAALPRYQVSRTRKLNETTRFLINQPLIRKYRAGRELIEKGDGPILQSAKRNSRHLHVLEIYRPKYDLTS